MWCRRKKYYISRTQQFRLEYEARTKIFSPNNITSSIRYNISLQRIITIWFLIGTMRKELESKFCIYIFFNNFSFIEELCMSICLSNLYSGKEWFLVYTKIFLCKKTIRDNSKEKKKEERSDLRHRGVSVFF
jgi:hypothetical protein